MDKALLGRRLLALRMRAGLSQDACGAAVGITGKAVSRWERGASYPSMDALVRLADLYGMSLAELFDGQASREGSNIATVAVTGGPCAGKTTAIPVLAHELEVRGYRVVTLPEAATLLMETGMQPGIDVSESTFQERILDLQLSLERAARITLERSADCRAVVLCDRGIMDGAAYLPAMEFPLMLARVGLSVDEAFERYDAVIHLESLAAAESAAYGMKGNAARREDVLGARAMEERIRRAWAGHPHVSFVPARDGMDAKIGDTLACVLSAAGCGRVLPHRRIFLIRKPNESALLERVGTYAEDVEQILLRPAGATERDGERVEEQGSKRRSNQGGGHMSETRIILESHARLEAIARDAEAGDAGVRSIGEHEGSKASGTKNVEGSRREYFCLTCSTDIYEGTARESFDGACERYALVIDGKRFRDLHAFADPSLHEVRHTRIHLAEGARRYEVRTYPFLPYQAVAIVECDESDLDAKPADLMPPYLQLIREIAPSPESFSTHAFACALAQGRF
ncbi:AAA family ATPase [Slackia exigua]|uniref:AAA family ATPase n=1 Tax=Slackia exigua TaxID=84109 RepID=UPI0028DC2055|nr:AAA family ATPase [Slackia exigua]